ncbi:MAG: hypothetical protein IPK26_21680 [Planctomycetes bacterium]|nr:hypothetical protein [Planctomycetota bacterium]
MEPTREDLLIARVIDRSEAVTDWDEIEQSARADAAVWRRVCEGLRDDALLRAAVAPALLVADRVDVPARKPQPVHDWRSAAGWLAAGVFALLWAFGRESPPPTDPAGGAVSTQSSGEPASPIPAGRTLGELSRVLVQAEPTEDGRSLRVVSMRRILEESVVDQVFQFDQDEVGDLRPTQVELASFQTPSDF